jgi:hypothetical protein
VGQGLGLRVKQCALERQSDAAVVVIVHVEAGFIGRAFAGCCGAELLRCEDCGIEEGGGLERVRGDAVQTKYTTCCGWSHNMSRHSHKIWGREGRVRTLGSGGAAGEDIAHVDAVG